MAKIICGVYARDSTDKQGDTIENQISQASEFISRLGPEYVVDEKCIFTDNAVSGYYTSVFDREAMKKAIDFARKKKYEVLVFKEVSRVGRDKQENPAIVGMFEQYGIRVIAINDNYDSLNKDNITFGILSVLAEQESRKTSVRVSSGKKEKARRGQWNANAPIGYLLNSNTKKLEIDPDTKGLVEEVFSLYTNSDIGNFLIAQRLNAKGLRTNNGNLFSRETVRNIIKNPAYIGNTVYGKKRNELQREYDDSGKMTKKKVQVKIDQDDWMVIENTHEPIIKKEMFYFAQEKLNGRAHNRTPRRAYHPLTGILFCGKCGEGMVCQKRSLNGKDYRYYICKTYHKYGRDTCSQGNINAAKIEPEIIDVVQKRLSNLSKLQLESFSNRSDDVARLEEELNRRSKEKEKVKKDQMDIFEQRDLFTEEAYKDQMITLKDRALAIDEELIILQNKRNAIRESEDKTANIATLTEKFLTFDTSNTEIMRSLLHQLIKKITVFGEDIDIEYVYDII